jgi:hypothetical protein
LCFDLHYLTFICDTYDCTRNGDEPPKDYLNFMCPQQLAPSRVVPIRFFNTAVSDYPWGRPRHYRASIRADLSVVFCYICRRPNLNTSVVQKTADTNHPVEIKVTQVKF